MVLSRLLFDGRHPAVRRDMGDSHELHRTVMAAFPHGAGGGATRAEHGVLFRVELVGLEPVVLVQSDTVPEWGALRERGLLRAEQRDVDPSALRLDDGRHLRFRLEANPTRKVARVLADGTRARQGRRVELTNDDARIGWLARCGERAGFTLSAVGGHEEVPDVRVTVLAKRGGRRRSRRVTVRSVRFDGHLVVTDRAALLHAIAEGVGPAKAYGCGLLSVAPASP